LTVSSAPSPTTVRTRHNGGIQRETNAGSSAGIMTRSHSTNGPHTFLATTPVRRPPSTHTLPFDRGHLPATAPPTPTRGHILSCVTIGDSDEDYHPWHKNYKPSSSQPQSNGHAEAAVKAMKNLVKKNRVDGRLDEDGFDRSMLEWRITPRTEDSIAPSQWLLGRLQRTYLPAHASAYDRTSKRRMMSADGGRNAKPPHRIGY
ncbi:Uncharacterized protein FKW44_009871, partial [Caligus rogercresseyi]